VPRPRAGRAFRLAVVGTTTTAIVAKRRFRLETESPVSAFVARWRGIRREMAGAGCDPNRRRRGDEGSGRTDRC
jgi:hypothetical protein